MTRSDGTAPFSVDYATHDETATAGEDYATASGTLQFGENENTKTISITINGDTTAEGDENFDVDLLNATNGATISDSQGIGSILNNDPSNGNDTLTGTVGNDVLHGLIGNDILYGLAGNDVLLGGAGADALDGGDGTDRAQYNDATAGLTADLLVPANNTGFAAGDSYVSIENLYGSNFADSLRGDAGANTIWGGNGDDAVDGSDGNDVLLGGAGSDTLTGGSGLDRFVFSTLTDSTPGQPDVITDFVHGSDIIDLSALDADTAITGDQAFTFAGLNANAAPHSMTWSESGGNTIVKADVDGDNAADFVLQLTGVSLQWAAADFRL